MNAAPGIVTSGTGPPNATVVVQPGMNVQPVVLVDQNGQYVTTSGSTATAGYLADLTGSVNVSQAAAPMTGQVLTATSGTTATWQSGSTETAGYLATQGTSVYVAGGSAPTAGMELVATSGSAATWQSGASGILTTGGDMLFESGVPALARLAGNTTSTKNFLTSTGAGGTANAPAWGTIATADLPVVPLTKGGTGMNLGGSIPLGYRAAYASIIAPVTAGTASSTLTSMTAFSGSAPSIILPNDGGTYEVKLSASEMTSSAQAPLAIGIGAAGTAIIKYTEGGLSGELEAPCTIITYATGSGQTIGCFAYSGGNYNISLGASANAPAELSAVRVA